MNYIISILLFCIVLFIYLHIYHHLKTSNDLEVYSIEEPSKDKLEEICNLRQPVYFNFNNDNLKNKCTLESLEENYGAFDIKLRDMNNIDDDNELGLPFVLTEALEIIQNDKQSRFISEINKDKLLNFYQKSFNFEKSVLENYKWRYRSGYCNYDSLVLSVDNQICGHAGLIPVKLRIDEKVQTVIWFTDFFISPGFRSKGYGKILTEAWMKICPTQITLCNNESLRIFKKFNSNNIFSYCLIFNY